jgi:hypothetical protein
MIAAAGADLAMRAGSPRNGYRQLLVYPPVQDL